MTDTPVYAGIDIGGTKIYSVIADASGKIMSRNKKKTKADKLDFKGIMERSAMCLQGAAEEAGIEIDDITTIGVGAPGAMIKGGILVHAPNLGWKNVPVEKTLKALLKRPVYAENDVNAGTYGEYCYGAGKKSKSLVGFFVGTGLGGGIVYHGELVCGENRMAAELGHVVVNANGRKCGCGHNGCLEAYASKSGMGRKFAYEIMSQGRESMLTELCSPESYGNVRSGILQECYKAKDALVHETLDEMAWYLGVGIANIITTLGPDKVVIGGGVFEALGKELMPKVRKAAKAYTHPADSFKDTSIVLAKLGDDAVALGAMAAAIHMNEGK